MEWLKYNSHNDKKIVQLYYWYFNFIIKYLNVHFVIHVYDIFQWILKNILFLNFQPIQILYLQVIHGLVHYSMRHYVLHPIVNIQFVQISWSSTNSLHINILSQDLWYN